MHTINVKSEFINYLPLRPFLTMLDINNEKCLMTLIDFMIVNWNFVEILKMLEVTLNGFYDFELKCRGKLVDLDPGWFRNFRLKCWGKWNMFQVDPSALDLILDWFYNFNSKFWEKWIFKVELDPGLILWFRVEMLRKISWPWRGWFCDFRLKCWGKCKMFQVDPSAPDLTLNWFHNFKLK